MEDGNIMNLQKKNGDYYALSHFKTSFICNEIGLSYDNISIKKARAALQESASNLDEINSENIPMENLPKTATDVEENVNDVISILSQNEASDVDGLPFRDLLGLDKALQTTRGKLVNNLAKLSEIDKEIKDLQELYKNARDRDDEDEEVSEELREQLREKYDERSNRSQIARIKETIYRVLHIDKTLGKKN